MKSRKGQYFFFTEFTTQKESGFYHHLQILTNVLWFLNNIYMTDKTLPASSEISTLAGVFRNNRFLWYKIMGFSCKWEAKPHGNICVFPSCKRGLREETISHLDKQRHLFKKCHIKNVKLKHRADRHINTQVRWS